MAINHQLLQRANHRCELCAKKAELVEYHLPDSEREAGAVLLLCDICETGIGAPNAVDVHHWRCLNESVWSTVPVIQVAVWRLLKQLDEPWTHELLDAVYLDDDTQAWANAPFDHHDAEAGAGCIDANGVQLAAGDTVVVIKDLPVKGTSMVAKRGTSVRSIGLTNNPEHIEGRVNGQRVVLLSCYVKKS